MNLKTKPIALVTGATSGIGKAISFALCDSGVDVIALGRSTANLGGTSERDGLRPLALDLTDRESIATTLEGEELDVLVNNAGIMPPSVGFDQMALSDIDATLEIDLSATLNTTRLVLPGTTAGGGLYSSQAPPQGMHRFRMWPSMERQSRR